MAFMHGEPQSGLPPCSRTLFELSNFSNLIGKTVWLLLPVPSSTPKPYSTVFSGDIYSRRPPHGSPLCEGDVLSSAI